MAKQATLADALAQHKKASEERERKQALLKVAASWVRARKSGDVELVKAASANLAAAITKVTMDKQAAIGARIRSARTKKQSRTSAEKRAGILTYLAPRYAKTRALQERSGVTDPGITGRLGALLFPDITQAKAQERLAGKRPGIKMTGQRTKVAPTAVPAGPMAAAQ